MTDLPTQLLADWSYFRLQTKVHHDLTAKGARIGAKKMTPEIRAVLEEMIDWCREQHLEPRAWIYSLFKGRGWIGAPKLARGHLCSEKQIWKYKKMKGLGFFNRRRRATAAEARDEAAFDPNRDLDRTVENLKTELVFHGHAQSCLDQVIERTLGYHPHSPVCQQCPVQKECVLKVQGFVLFDILALRLGRLTSSQAEAIQERRYG